MTHELSIPLWALLLLAGAFAAGATMIGGHVVRHFEAVKAELFTKYQSGYTEGIEAGIPRGMLQAGVSLQDHYRDAFRKELHLVEKSNDAFDKGYAAGKALGEQLGRARLRVFTATKTSVQKKFVGSHTIVAHHLVIMFGEEVVFSTYDLKNTSKEEFDKVFKEVLGAVGPIAGIVTGHPGAAAAAAAAKVFSSANSDDDSAAAA